MDARFLIDAIVRQTTVLIAQLATSGGIRAPLAHIADQVFRDLSSELEAQGVSRKVSADMFGMALRTYLRKLQRVSESSTDRGQSLWSAVYRFIQQEGTVGREHVLERFAKDDDVLVRGVLRDLTESGLVFATGVGNRTVYRIATDEDLERVSRNGSDELVWAVIYREGPLGLDELLERAPSSRDSVTEAVDRLVRDGRVERSEGASGPRLSASELFVPLGAASSGWEAAVYDHFHAVVHAISRKLQGEPRATSTDTVGASTYTFDVWSGHPFEEEVLGLLRRYRETHSALRERIDAFNQANPKPARWCKVVAYAGQYISEEETS